MLRQKVLSASLPFEARLDKQRTRLVNSIAKGLKALPISEWEQWASNEVN